MTQINVVNITPDFRLVTEERQYVIQRRHVIDPTKAPGFKREENAVYPLREEWRDNTFYSLTAGGFVAAVDNVIRRTTGESAETLAGLVAAYKAEVVRLDAMLKTEVIV